MLVKGPVMLWMMYNKYYWKSLINKAVTHAAARALAWTGEPIEIHVTGVIGRSQNNH